VRGATLSEHGRANALDVRAFKLASGQMVELTDVNVAKVWREGIRAGACARFATVLGPGSDGHHEEHIHVDLMERRGGYKMCQWEVRESAALVEKKEPPAGAAAPAASAALPEPVPLPRARPLAANASRDVQLRASRTRAQ
jgi:Extensin-like protein C-terminus